MAMDTDIRPRLSVFHCINSFDDSDYLPGMASQAVELTFIKMACSSMVKDVFLLRAFEAGADAVIVLVCPEGQCRFVEGNIRAKKRVTWVQSLLDQIGLDGRRLALHNVSAVDDRAAEQAIREMMATVAELGPNPAA